MKWKNYGLWVSITSILYMVLKDLGYQIDLTRWDTYVTAILGILVTLGVISNPESGKGYFDAKAKVPPSPNNQALNEHTTAMTNENQPVESAGDPAVNQQPIEDEEPIFDPNDQMAPTRRDTPNEK